MCSKILKFKTISKFTTSRIERTKPSSERFVVNPLCRAIFKVSERRLAIREKLLKKLRFVDEITNMNFVTRANSIPNEAVSHVNTPLFGFTYPG